MFQDVERVLTNSDAYLQQAVPLSLLYTWTPGLLACNDDDLDADDDTGFQDINQVIKMQSKIR